MGTAETKHVRLSERGDHSVVHYDPTKRSDNRTGHDVVLPSAKPFHRPGTKKRDLFSQEDVFRLADAHVAKTPTEVTINTDRLLTYLMSSCSTPLSTVRTVYMWTQANIRYDASPVSLVDSPRFDPQKVLNTKQGSLSDINLLFHHFCQHLSIPCVCVSGVVRTVDQSPFELRHDTPTANHVWCLVLVQEEWRFVDCALAGGCLEEDSMSRSVVLEFFFLTDPEDFIMTHFPLSMSSLAVEDIPKSIHSPSNWSMEVQEGLQMLEIPIPYSQFSGQAILSVFAQETALELTSHPMAQVSLTKSETFSFRSEQLRNMAAVLRERTSGLKQKHCVLCTRGGKNTFRVVVKPKVKGEFKLSVSGQPRNAIDDSFHLLVNYYITVIAVEEVFVPLPEHSGAWGASPQALGCGFSDRIFRFDVLACRSGEVYIKLPTTRFVGSRSAVTLTREGVVDRDVAGGGGGRDGHMTLNQYTEGVVHIRARFSERGFHRLSLLAQRDDVTDDAGSSYINVADFLIHSQNSSLMTASFPRIFPTAQGYRCLLLEPLVGELALNKPVLIRLQSTLLTRVKVEGLPMSRESLGDDDSDVWCLEYTPARPGVSVCIYGGVGSGHAATPLSALYKFYVVCKDVLTVSTHM